MLVKTGVDIPFLNFYHNTSKYHRKEPPASQGNKAKSINLPTTATESTSHFRPHPHKDDCKCKR